MGDDAISTYYRQQNSLCPPYTDARGYIEPWTLVTANCLVLKKAFQLVRGFDERYTLAGGEDTDIGLRLRRIGRLGFQFDSRSFHYFEDGFEGFVKRFIGYGLGNRLLSEQYGINMRPTALSPNHYSLVNLFLATVHYKSFLHGLDGLTWDTFNIEPLMRELSLSSGVKEINRLTKELGISKS